MSSSYYSDSILQVKKWLQQHRVNVVDQNKRAYKHARMNVKFFSFPTDFNRMDEYAIQCETETLYTVEISESELIRIAEFEAQVYNNLDRHGHQNLFEIMLEQKRREKELRQKYKAVQIAYEQYSAALALVSNGEF